MTNNKKKFPTPQTYSENEAVKAAHETYKNARFHKRILAASAMALALTGIAEQHSGSSAIADLGVVQIVVAGALATSAENSRREQNQAVTEANNAITALQPPMDTISIHIVQ